MKRVVLFLCFFLPTLFLVSAPQVIDIRTEGLPPFVCSINSKTHPGLAIEVLRAIFPADKYTLNFRNAGWQWSMRGLQRNEFNAYLGVCKADYQNLAYPRTPFFKTGCAVYLKKDLALHYENPESLAKIKTGFPSDYSISDEFDAFQKNHEKDGAVVFYSGWNSVDKMLRELKQNKIQAIVAETTAMNWSISRIRKSAETIVRVKDLSNFAEYYLAFAPGKQESWKWIAHFDREFPKFKKTEAYRNLLKKYGQTETSF